MTNARPIVSVVMATYNGAAFIREQIDSILNQTYPISELIIQDDCSTDSTPAICREYEAKYPIVHFYENEHNLGFNDNFRTAAMRATGDFIAISDQDDVWFPEKIAKQVAAIGNHDICCTGIIRGEAIEKAIPEPECCDSRLGTHLFRDVLGHTMLLTKRFAQNGKNWEEPISYDWGLTLHADWGNGIINIKEPLNFHRVNDQSVSYQQGLIARDESIIAQYIHGLKFFRELQHMPKFASHCNYIREHTKGKKENKGIQLQYQLSTLFLSASFVDFLRLCLVCMVRRKEIYYPINKAYGLKGILRGALFPIISAYYRSVEFV
jgi:glycosyltransferase involved in cell wall biosynthesis